MEPETRGRPRSEAAPTGFALAELIRDHRPVPGEVRTITWVEARAA